MYGGDGPWRRQGVCGSPVACPGAKAHRSRCTVGTGRGGGRESAAHLSRVLARRLIGRDVRWGRAVEEAGSLRLTCRVSWREGSSVEMYGGDGPWRRQGVCGSPVACPGAKAHRSRCTV